MIAGFRGRTRAMMIKEIIQLRRDRVSFAMIVMIPLMQLVLFGYAINTTPRNLPTAVLLQEHSDLGRAIVVALENTGYFRVTHRLESVDEFDAAQNPRLDEQSRRFERLHELVESHFVECILVARLQRHQANIS